MNKLLTFLFFALISTLNPAWSAELTILTENLPPLNFTRDGKLVGLPLRLSRKFKGGLAQPRQYMSIPGPEHTKERYKKRISFCLG